MLVMGRRSDASPMQHPTPKSPMIVFTTASLALALIFCQEAEAQSITGCMGQYQKELDAAAALVKSDGNMSDYFKRRKFLYLNYFDLNAEFSPRIMVDNQKYVDVWDAYERGIIDITQALNKTRQYQIEMESEPPYDPRTFICKDKFPQQNNK